MFLPHPSARLNDLFGRKPHQVSHPAEAKFLFVGLDANYAPDIESSPIFASLLKYHEDGVSFWQRCGVHHTFLLPRYRGDGRRYHQAFARIGFEPRHAHLVSFIELLHLPTVGTSGLKPEDFLAEHLNYVNEVIVNGRAEHVFVSSSVLRHMHQSKRFPWARLPKPSSTLLPVVHRTARLAVYQHLHLSYQWGRVEQLRSEAEGIANLIPRSDR